MKRHLHTPSTARGRRAWFVRHPVLRGLVVLLLAVLFSVGGMGVFPPFDINHIMAVAETMWLDLKANGAGAIHGILFYPDDAEWGRLWPLMRPYFLLVYLFTGGDFVWWQVWNIVLLAVSLQLVYSITRSCTRHPWAPFLACLITIACPWFIHISAVKIQLETPLLFLACVQLYCLITLDRPGVPTIRRAGAATGAFLTASSMLMLKESSVALPLCVVAWGVCTAWSGPREAKRIGLAMALATLLVMVMLLRAVLQASPGDGSYTGSYFNAGIVAALGNFSGYMAMAFLVCGPLFLVALFLLSARILHGIRNRTLSPQLKWRLFVALAALGLTVIASPWIQLIPVQPYLLLPVVPWVAVWIAVEAVAFHRMLRIARKRTAPGGQPSSALAFLLAISFAVGWLCFTMESHGHPAVNWVRVASLMPALAIGGFVLWRVHAPGGFMAMLHAPGVRRMGSAWLVWGWGHLAVFGSMSAWLVVIAQFGPYPFIGGVAPYVTKEALEYVAENAPPGARVVMYGNRALFGAPPQHDFDEFALYATRALGRPDMEFVPMNLDAHNWDPQDTVVFYCNHPPSPAMDIIQALHHEPRPHFSMTRSALVLRPMYWLHPLNMLAWLWRPEWGVRPEGPPVGPAFPYTQQLDVFLPAGHALTD